MTTREGGETSDVATICLPEARPEDSAVTKAELLERRIGHADGGPDEDRPLKKLRLESDESQGQVKKERQKGVAAIKPQYERTSLPTST